jgi:hypothetical protein
MHILTFGVFALLFALLLPASRCITALIITRCRRRKFTSDSQLQNENWEKLGSRCV